MKKVTFVYVDYDTGIYPYKVQDSICTFQIDDRKIQHAFDLLDIEVLSIEKIKRIEAEEMEGENKNGKG